MCRPKLLTICIFIIHNNSMLQMLTLNFDWATEPKATETKFYELRLLRVISDRRTWMSVIWFNGYETEKKKWISEFRIEIFYLQWCHSKTEPYSDDTHKTIITFGSDLCTKIFFWAFRHFDIHKNFIWFAYKFYKFSSKQPMRRNVVFHFQYSNEFTDSDGHFT